MRSLFPALISLLAVGCTTSDATNRALVLRAYSVRDIIAAMPEGGRVGAADLASNVVFAAGLDQDVEQVTADDSARLVARAYPASHRRIEQVLTDMRRLWQQD
ncbi:MAG: hypothetical protein NXI31_10255 [bacterium]|nr:hypothetical protein [bacterium]